MAQSWENVYPLVAPQNADPGFDLDRILKARKIDEREMTRYGERFFVSLGFAPLPETFWARSLFTKPRDREVVCHASAWDVDNVDDLRIKMCIEPTAEDFITIHHELGHNFYQRAYNQQPMLFRDSANDGFHEALGDTVALSMTPEYFVKLGFIDKASDPSKDTGLLLKQALEKVAFLPFGILIDQWRWKVFSGEVTPEKYNQVWWELRQKYQGVAAPVARSESDFDPGAKYSRAGQCSLYAILPGARAPVPVPPGAGGGGRLQGAPAPLLGLSEQGCRRAVERHDADGHEPPVAGGAQGADRAG